jgi:hypothetical protein
VLLVLLRIWGWRLAIRGWMRDGVLLWKTRGCWTLDVVFLTFCHVVCDNVKGDCYRFGGSSVIRSSGTLGWTAALNIRFKSDSPDHALARQLCLVVYQ